MRIFSIVWNIVGQGARVKAKLVRRPIWGSKIINKFNQKSNRTKKNKMKCENTTPKFYIFPIIL